MSRIRISGKLPFLRYPPFYKGAPQRRLFFPDWYIKVVKPPDETPSTYARFHVPHDMTRYDVKEYLEKIYNIPVASVRLMPVTWVRFKDEANTYQFMDPYNVAHVRLGQGQRFEFPELLKAEKEDDHLNTVEAYEKQRKALREMRPQEARDGVEAKSHFENSWLR